MPHRQGAGIGVMSDPTMEQILAMKRYAKDHKIKPLVVKTHEQAKQMTRDDHTWHRWEKGEGYYIVIAGENEVYVQSGTPKY